jgi:Arc/MetJ-type ribon-helix-helix transcriptional regulator
MANVVIDIAAQYTGNKAFKQAETATSKLEKSVAKLGKQLAGVFAASKIYAFGKNAVKAFAADEKAARSLALALANTGNAFAAIGVEKFIADLQRATGVLDDNLRPAFRTLLTATGDVKKSQDALALALDISAGTGRDLGQVSLALARGFTGQTTALSRLGAGLSKATLKAGDMDVIIGELSDKFRGQALAAAEGYAGSIAKLTVASENAKEIIGKDLLDAMRLIAGKDGIGGATTAMEGFATEIGNAIYGVGVLIAKLREIPGVGFIGDVLSTPTGALGLAAMFGRNRKATAAGNPAQSPGQRAAIDRANKEALRLQKSKNELTKIDNDNTARKLTLTADQLALLELEKKFDVERVGLYAALNQSTDSETKMRLLSLIAIKDQNEAMAGMIKKANETGDAFGSLIEAIRASIRAMLDNVAAELAQLRKMTTTGANTPIEQQRAIVREKLNLAIPDISALQNNLRLNAGSINTASSGSPTYVINASGIGDQQIAAVVQGAIQDLNRYGNSTTYAGAI